MLPGGGCNATADGSACAATCAAGNVLQQVQFQAANLDFEAGNLTGWAVTGPTPEAVDVTCTDYLTRNCWAVLSTYGTAPWTAR